jgi:hypothetical protein
MSNPYFESTPRPVRKPVKVPSGIPHYIIGDPKVSAPDDAYVIIDKAALERGEAAIQYVSHGPYETIRHNYSRIRFVDCKDLVIEQLPSPQQDGTRIRITNLGLMEVFE